MFSQICRHTFSSWLALCIPFQAGCSLLILSYSLILVVVWRRVHPKCLKEFCTLTLKNFEEYSLYEPKLFNKTTTPVQIRWIAPMKQVRMLEISYWNTVLLCCAHSWGKGRQNWNVWKVYNGYVTRKCGFFFFLELVCVTKQMLWELYMDFSFDMGTCFLVSMELLRKLQKKGLEKSYFKIQNLKIFKILFQGQRF